MIFGYYDLYSYSLWSSSFYFFFSSWTINCSSVGDVFLIFHLHSHVAFIFLFCFSVPTIPKAISLVSFHFLFYFGYIECPPHTSIRLFVAFKPLNTLPLRTKSFYTSLSFIQLLLVLKKFILQFSSFPTKVDSNFIVI